MKKNLLYLAVLIGLGWLAYELVFRENDVFFDKKEANFTIKDTASIEQLFLSDKYGSQVKLSRDGKAWKLNDTMTPRVDAIDYLLSSLAEQVADQPVPSGYHDGAIKELSTYGTKVEVYMKGKKSHTFYVAKNAGYGNVTYMLMEGAKRPYIVKIPARGNMFLGIRYFTRITDWRERRMLYADAPIEKVRVTYKDSIQYSFELETSLKEDKVLGQILPAQPLNKQRVEAYIRGLDKIYCTGFEDRFLGKDSIINYGLQLGTVEVMRKGQAKEQLIVYYKPTERGTKESMMLGGREYEAESFFGLLNGRDFLVMSRKNTEKIFRSFQEFYTAED